MGKFLPKKGFFVLVAALALVLGVLVFLWPTASLFFLAIFWVAILIWKKTSTAFFLLVLYLPFQVALNLTNDIDLVSGRVLVLVFFLIAAAKYFLDGGDFRAFFKNRISLFLLLFFCLAAISGLVAAEQSWAIRKILFLFSWLPLYFLTVYLIDDDEKSQRLVWLAALGAGISALVGLLQFLAQFIVEKEVLLDFWLTRLAPIFSGASFSKLIQINNSWLAEVSGRVYFRAVGLFPDPHMMSFYLGMALPFCLALFFLQKKHKKLLGGLCLLILAAIFFTFSRGGYLGVLASLFFFLVTARNLITKKDKKFLAVMLLLLAVLIVSFSPIMGRWGSIFSLEDGSNLGRLEIWRQSFLTIKENPILGLGIGNYSFGIDFSQNYRNSMTSHNLYLDLWVELGIFGLLAWLSLFFISLRVAWGGRRQNSLLALGGGGALVYFLVHSFFETAIFNPTVLAFLLIYLGLLSRIEKNVYNN